MAENRNAQVNSIRRPKGFSRGVRGPAGENAHEQGWQLNEEERTRVAKSLQGKTGGRDYSYGARDFGDRPTNAGSTDSQRTSSQQIQSRQSSKANNTNHRERVRH